MHYNLDLQVNAKYFRKTAIKAKKKIQELIDLSQPAVSENQNGCLFTAFL